MTQIRGDGRVAAKYGLEEAVFLDALIFWWRTNRGNNRNYAAGRWWTYNSVKAYTDMFPWWTDAQIRRIIARCKEKGAVLTGNHSEDRRDRTVWYSPSDELLAMYGEENANCICPNEQMQPSEQTSSFADSDKCNKDQCNKHSDKPYSPLARDGAVSSEELFERFWLSYPKVARKNKERARRAWAKLKPDLELCRVMSAALELDKQSYEWNKEGGRYIPHPSSWLNGRRWEDEHTPPPQENTGGSAPLRGEGVRYL